MVNRDDNGKWARSQIDNRQLQFMGKTFADHNWLCPRIRHYTQGCNPNSVGPSPTDLQNAGIIDHMLDVGSNASAFTNRLNNYIKQIRQPTPATITNLMVCFPSTQPYH